MSPEPLHTVANTGLAELVRLARAQEPGVVGVTATDIHAGMRKRQWRRAVVGSGAMLVAATLAWAVLRPPAALTPPMEEVAPAQVVASEHAGQPAAVAELWEPVPKAGAIVGQTASRFAYLEVIATTQSVIADRQGRAVLGPGVYRIEVPERVADGVQVVVASRILLVTAGSRLELEVGELEVSEQVIVRVHSGHARWLDPELDSELPETVRSPGQAAPAPKAALASAATLSDRAEAQLAASHNARARKTLALLVRRFPKTPQARAGLVDLARLHKAAGNDARARCAYELFSARWPGSGLRVEVDKALAKLGPGAKCRGLRPL